MKKGYRVMFTLFWVRLAWPHVVEIHLQVEIHVEMDIYRAVVDDTTVFALG